MGNDDEVKDNGPKRSRGPRSSGSTGRSSSGRRGASSRGEDGKELALRSRSMFLHDIRQQLSRKELYSLDDEFAKTKKNRSPVVILSVSLFVVVMVAIGVAVTTYIQQRSQNVPVNISAFQDVNLMELLDRAKQINDQLTSNERDLQTLQSNETDEVSSVQEDESHQMQLINNQLISDSEKRTRIAAVRRQARNRIDQIHAKYAEPIKTKNDEIARLQNEAAQYDTRQMQQAKKQEAILNNQQKLFDMQMQKTESYYNQELATLTNQYQSQISSINQHNQQLVDLMKHNHAVEIADLIKKYNPTFTSPDIVAVLNEPIPADPATSVGQDPFVKMAVRAGVVSASNVSELQARINNFALLISTLQKVPYENSVPPALAHLRYFNSQIVEGYRAIGQGLTEIVAQRNQVIEQLRRKVASDNKVIADRDSMIGEYNHALSVLVRNSRENGYVLDARNPSSIAVFVDPLYRVKSGDTAYVFRRDDQKIGTIRFTVGSDGTVRAQQISLANNDVTMQPFDKILLNLK